jgi:hypothetical protein
VFDVTSDFDESEDLAKASAETLETLETLINDGLEWSKTHQDPQWHDTRAALESWNANDMPRYQKTFSKR